MRRRFGAGYTLAGLDLLLHRIGWSVQVPARQAAERDEAGHRDAMTGLVAARDWLTVYRLPPYAHELNPVEPVWSHLKRSLANLAKRNLAQLTALIKTRLKRMQYRPGLLGGFLASTGLDLTPFCNPRN